MAEREDTNKTSMRFLDCLGPVLAAAQALIRSKSETYGPSWKRRGGAGAWFTLVRPWDRLETIVERHGGDVFAAVAAEPSGCDGTALDAIRDCRNYLTLIEAEMVARGVVEGMLAASEGTAGCGNITVSGVITRNHWDRPPGARPTTLDDGQETCHDMGMSREPWYQGLSRLRKHKPHLTHGDESDLATVLGGRCKISSRRLDDGTIQLDIRIP